VQRRLADVPLCSSNLSTTTPCASLRSQSIVHSDWARDAGLVVDLAQRQARGAAVADLLRRALLVAIALPVIGER
jgi:hypothetical protein